MNLDVGIPGPSLPVLKGIDRFVVPSFVGSEAICFFLYSLDSSLIIQPLASAEVQSDKG